MYTKQNGFKLDQPAAPGRFLAEEIIAAEGLTITEAAAILGVTRPALSALLNGRSSLSVEMAIRFDKAFGVKMETLLAMQTACDLAAARAKFNQIKVERYVGKMNEKT
ncbi:MAG: HigA family addiction module antitoxin [Candidatus Pacebacteria bacterium]|nr:HigA family addiction module antitoxin [Candidatus Paceibacterota bacterium]